MSGKGSGRRPGNDDKYQDNWDLIWNKEMNKKDKNDKDERIKSRYHKQLFDKDSPFGHRVHRDKTKTNPRKDKYPLINTLYTEE